MKNAITEIKAAQREHVVGKLTFFEFMEIVHDTIMGANCE